MLFKEIHLQKVNLIDIEAYHREIMPRKLTGELAVSTRRRGRIARPRGSCAARATATGRIIRRCTGRSHSNIVSRDSSVRWRCNCNRKKKSKQKIAFLAPSSSLLDKAHKYARYAWHLYTIIDHNQRKRGGKLSRNFCMKFCFVV